MKELILLWQADSDIQAAFNRYQEYQAGRVKFSYGIWIWRSNSFGKILKSDRFTKDRIDDCYFMTFLTVFFIKFSRRESLLPLSRICDRTLK